MAGTCRETWKLSNSQIAAYEAPHKGKNGEVSAQVSWNNKKCTSKSQSLNTLFSLLTYYSLIIGMIDKIRSNPILVMTCLHLNMFFDFIYCFTSFNSQCGSLHMTSCIPGVSSMGTVTGIWSRTFTWPWIKWRTQWPGSGDGLLELSLRSTAWRSWGHPPSSEIRRWLMEHLHVILRWSCWVNTNSCAIFLIW